MKNVYDLLKDGGDFLLTMIAKHHIFDSYKVLSQYPQWKEFMVDYESPISPYNDSLDPVGDFRKILNLVGFKDILVDHVYKKHTFNGHQCLRGMLIIFFGNNLNVQFVYYPGHLMSFTISVICQITFCKHFCVVDVWLLFIATAAAVNPFLKKIPVHLHQEYLDDYINYVKRLGFVGEDNNAIGKYTYSVLMAYGVKSF